MNLKKSYNILKSYRNDPLRYLHSLQLSNGHRTHLNVFGKNLFIISDPEDVFYVLKTNDKNYSKGRSTQMFRSLLGNGLLTNEGSSWKEQHKLIRPMMNIKSMLNFIPRIESVVAEFLPAYMERSDMNAFQKMNLLTWSIALKTLFTEELTPELTEWLEDVQDLVGIITRRTRTSLPLPVWVPTADNRRLKKIIKRFDSHIYGMIEKRKTGEKKNDLLQHLINTGTMSELQIRDEIMTFMMAGHETVTSSISWTLIELGKNPDYIKRIREELKQTSFMDASLLGAVIKEGLRVWPAIWVFMREAKDWDKIGDLAIPPKSNVVLSVYNSHHAKDIWANPDLFYPERFLQDKEFHVGAFYPFGLGPRACIGANFADIEARIVLSHIINNYDWEITTPEEQRFDAGISLRPLSNLNIQFRKI